VEKEQAEEGCAAELLEHPGDPQLRMAMTTLDPKSLPDDGEESSTDKGRRRYGE